MQSEAQATCDTCVVVHGGALPVYTPWMLADVSTNQHQYEEHVTCVTDVQPGAGNGMSGAAQSAHRALPGWSAGCLTNLLYILWQLRVRAARAGAHNMHCPWLTLCVLMSSRALPKCCSTCSAPSASGHCECSSFTAHPLDSCTSCCRAGS